MNSSLFNKSLLFVAVLLLATQCYIAASLPRMSASPAPVAGDIGTNITGALTAANASVTSASSQLLATSSARQYAAFVNDGAVNVYLSVGASAVADKGILLTPGGSWEITNENLITGAVYGVTSTGSANIAVLYK